MIYARVRLCMRESSAFRAAHIGKNERFPFLQTTERHGLRLDVPADYRQALRPQFLRRPPAGYLSHLPGRRVPVSHQRRGGEPRLSDGRSPSDMGTVVQGSDAALHRLLETGAFRGGVPHPERSGLRFGPGSRAFGLFGGRF